MRMLDTTFFGGSWVTKPLVVTMITRVYPVQPKRVEKDSKSKASSWFRILLDHLQQFSDKSSIHGVVYIGDKGIPPFHRFMWMILVISSLVTCSLFIYNEWDKWRTSPIILSFNTTTTHVIENPFPTIIVCPKYRAKRGTFEKLQNLHKLIPNLNDAQKQEYFALWYTCNGQFRNMTVPATIQNMNLSLMLESAWDGTMTAEWGGETRHVPVSRVYTKMGFCYVVNMGVKYIYPIRRRYVFGEPLEDPHHAISHLAYMAMHISGEQGDDKCVQNFIHEDYMIAAGNPLVWPHMYAENIDGVRVLKNIDLHMTVHVDIISTSEDVHKYPLNIRNCYLRDERKLIGTSIYIENVCVEECWTEASFKHRGCVQEYNYYPADYVPICNLVGMFPGSMRVQKSGFICDCRPECNHIEYKLESRHENEFDEENPHHKFSENSSVERINNKFTLKYFKTYFISRTRTELTGITDFLANCAGFLGVFLGFSVLSLAELLYYIFVWTIAAITSSTRTAFGEYGHKKPGFSNKRVDSMKNYIHEIKSYELTRKPNVNFGNVLY